MSLAVVVERHQRDREYQSKKTNDTRRSDKKNARECEERKSAGKSLRGVQPPVHLEEEMGAMLGRSHNLFEELQREEEAREATAAKRRGKGGRAAANDDSDDEKRRRE